MISEAASTPQFFANTCYSTRHLCGCVKDSICFLQDTFNDISIVKWWQKYEPQVLVSKTSTFVISGKKVILEVLARTGQWRAQCGSFKTILKIYENAAVVNILNISKIVSLAYAPYSLYKILKFSIEFFSGNAGQKIEASLEMINESSSLIDSTIAFGRGLYHIGKLSEKYLCYASPLAIISTLFSTASICLNVKSIYDSERFLKRMGSVDESKRVRWLRKQEAKELGKIFKCNGALLKASLIQCTKDVNGADAEQYQLSAARLFQLRLHNRKKCESLAVISSIVNLLGIATLFVAGANPLGYVLIAASAGIYTFKYIIDKVAYKKMDSFITPNHILKALSKESDGSLDHDGVVAT